MRYTALSNTKYSSSKNSIFRCFSHLSNNCNRDLRFTSAKPARQPHLTDPSANQPWDLISRVCGLKFEFSLLGVFNLLISKVKRSLELPKPYYKSSKATYSRGKAWVGADGKAGFKKDFSRKFNYSSNSTYTTTKKKKKDYNYSPIIKPKRNDLA